MVEYFKKYGLKKTIAFYNLLYLLIYGLIILILKNHIINLLSNLINQHRFDNFIETYIPFFLFAFWCYLSFHHIRKKTYFFKTKRNLGYDLSHYKRSYHQLVDYFKDADPYQMNTEALPKKSWKEVEGLIFGKTDDERIFHLPSSKDGSNTFIFGLPGIGKTAGPIICSALKFGIHSAIDPKNQEEQIPESNGSVFCIDIKGDIYAATHKYRNIKCFDLIHPEKSCHFNPLAGIEHLNMDERCLFIENLGFNLIPDSNNERYFSDTAKDYFNGIALYFLDKDIHTSFPTIVKEILNGNAVDWVKQVMSDGSPQSRFRLASKYGENPKNLAGSYALLCNSIRSFSSDTLSNLLDNTTNVDYISVQSLEDGYDVYIEVEQTQLANYAPLLSMITQSFFLGILKREKNSNVGKLEDGTLRPVCFILDEFAQLTTLSYDIVAALFMTGRSRNISCVCALQSISSIKEMFHSDNACKSLIDCVNTFAFLGIQETETRKWASDLIGTRKVLHITNNINMTSNTHQTGRSVTETREPIIQPESFGSLKNDNKDELIVYHKGTYITLKKIYHFT